MKPTDHDERSEEQDAAFEVLSADRDDTTPIEVVLAQLREARREVARARNQNRISRAPEM